MRYIRKTRWAGMLAVAFLMLPLSACDEILLVNNPDQIPVADLDDPALLLAQVQGVIADFHDLYTNDESILDGANFLTDEIVTGLNWEDWARVNQRIVNYIEGPVDGIWSNLSRVVRQGEGTLARLDEFSATPGTDWRVAVTALLTGYAYLLTGETMCHAVFSTDPDNPSSTIELPNQMFQRAILLLQRAVTVGTAANRAEFANAARVGLARAYLNLGDFPNTIAAAQAVPAGFVYWIQYSDAQSVENNGLYGNMQGSNHRTGVSPFFLQGTFGTQNLVATQTDPRIQHFRSWTRGHNALTQLYKPFQGLRFSEYSGNTIAPASAACPNCTGTVPSSTGNSGGLLLVQRGTDVVLGNYLEAQHHMNEAMVRSGQNLAAVSAFVDARRAVGNQVPLGLATQAAIFAELRNQRARDFYLGGLRLGDLRRWARDGVGNFFPTGAHVNTEWGQYSVWTCFPLPLEEYEGNASLTKPANPLDPPGI